MKKRLTFLAMLFVALSLTMVACKTNSDDSTNNTPTPDVLVDTSWIGTLEGVRYKVYFVTESDFQVYSETTLGGWSPIVSDGTYTLSGSTIHCSCTGVDYKTHTFDVTLDNDTIIIPQNVLGLPHEQLTLTKQ